MLFWVGWGVDGHTALAVSVTKAAEHAASEDEATVASLATEEAAELVDVEPEALDP